MARAEARLELRGHPVSLVDAVAEDLAVTEEQHPARHRGRLGRRSPVVTAEAQRVCPDLGDAPVAAPGGRGGVRRQAHPEGVVRLVEVEEGEGLVPQGAGHPLDHHEAHRHGEQPDKYARPQAHGGGRGGLGGADTIDLLARLVHDPLPEQVTCQDPRHAFSPKQDP